MIPILMIAYYQKIYKVQLINLSSDTKYDVVILAVGHNEFKKFDPKSSQK